MATALSRADSGYMQEVPELRVHIVRVLQGRADAIVRDAIAVYPFAGMERVGVPHRARLAELAIQVLISAVRDSGVKTGNALVGDLGQHATANTIDIRTLFTILYHVERSAL